MRRLPTIGHSPQHRRPRQRLFDGAFIMHSISSSPSLPADTPVERVTGPVTQGPVIVGGRGC